MRPLGLHLLLFSSYAIHVFSDCGASDCRAVKGSESSDIAGLLQGGVRLVHSQGTVSDQESVDLHHRHHRLPPLAMQEIVSDAMSEPLAKLQNGSSCYDIARKGTPANWLLSDEQIRRGALNLNGASRFEALRTKLSSGGSKAEQLRILVIGGSMEMPGWPDPSVLQYEQKWPNVVARWFRNAFDLSTTPIVQFFDMQGHALQLSSAANYSFDDDKAWAQMLSSAPNYDIAFITGSMNSPLKGKPGFSSGAFSLVKGAPVRRRFDEDILRGLLNHPNAPPVMLVEWFYTQELFKNLQATWHKDAGEDPRAYMAVNGLDWEFSSWEDESYNFLSTYYEIPMVSGRSALLHSTELNSADGSSLGPRFNSKDIFCDGLHPNANGHMLLSQLIQFSICEQLHPPAPAQQSALAQAKTDHSQLPPAVFAQTATQIALRRGTELSGFSTLETKSSAHATQSGLKTVPARSVAVPARNGPAPSSDSRFNSSNTSSMLAWELRVTVLPLAVLEVGALLSMSQQAPPIASSEGPGLRTFGLEPFRFVGVLHIVFMHELIYRKKQWWETFASFGKYWVQFFYALSGFALYISQGGSPDVPQPASFIMKRVSGIYPVYFIGTLLAILAAEAPLQAASSYISQSVLPGFLLIDSWASPYGVQSPDGPAWFVCTLFAFWLSFPRWYRFLRGFSAPKLAALLAYLSTFGLPLLYAAQNVGNKCQSSPCAQWGAFAEFHPFSNWQVFFFGMCLGRILQEVDANIIPSLLRKTAASVALLAFLTISLYSPMPSGSVLTLFFDKGPLLLPVFAVLLYFLPLGDDLLLQPAFLESRIPQYLGAISGHLFLLHIPTRLLLARIVVGGASVLVTVILQLLVAVAFYEAHTRLMGPLRSKKAAQSSSV